MSSLSFSPCLVMMAMVMMLFFLLFSLPLAEGGNTNLPSSVLLKQTDWNTFPPSLSWTNMAVKKLRVTSRGSDGEFIDASNHFFWNHSNGLALELGAVDGVSLSETKLFTKFGWNRLLIEANPRFVSKLVKQLDATIVHAAVCDEQRKVHFYNMRHESGIVELAEHLTDGWKALKLKHSSEVDCLPLSTIFAGVNVTKIDFFILDVEGAELNVLRSIDWDKLQISVLVVETEKGHRRPNYAEDVAAYLQPKGYVQVDNIPGRNSWFRHVDFIPSRRPTIAEGCFSGALWSCRWRSKNATIQEYYKHCPPGYFYGDRCQNCDMIL